MSFREEARKAAEAAEQPIAIHDTVGQELREKVDAWAAQFDITVSDYHGTTHGFAGFIGTTDDGERMPLGAAWHSDHISIPRAFSVWLSCRKLGTGSESINLGKIEDFDKAFAEIGKRAARKWRRNNR